MVCIDKGHIKEVKEYSFPPLLREMVETVVGDQLICLVNTSHVLVVLVDHGWLHVGSFLLPLSENVTISAFFSFAVWKSLGMPLLLILAVPQLPTSWSSELHTQ